MKLRPYQAKNSQEIWDLWEQYNAILYQLPTGGGKTVVINDIIEKILNKKDSTKIIILVHRQEIIFQIRDRLKDRGIVAGVLIGSFEENIESNILIGSILTVARDTRLQSILNRGFEYMIIDEAHHACSDSYIKTIENFENHNKNYKLLGVTATPYRKDNKKLNKVFQVLLKGPTYSELREDGYLADYTCYAAKLEGLEGVNLSGGDYKLSDLSKYMRSPSLIKKAIEMYKTKGNNKQMLVFCVDKKHSMQVRDAYIKAGYTKIAHIDSDTPNEQRQQINIDYREGKLDIITSIQTLTEGTDLPETGVVQLLRPTLSIVLYLQILGRGVRVKKDKSKLIILDCSNGSYEHGLLDSNFNWTLENENPNPDKKLNKIVGKSKKGLYIEDHDEIDAEYLEIEEITHEEFLIQNRNAIEIAENENKEKENQIKKIYFQTIEYLNTNFPSFKFTPVSNITEYNHYLEIKVFLDKNQAYDLNYDKTDKSLVLEINPGSWTRKIHFKNFPILIIGGELAKFLTLKKHLKVIVSNFNEMLEIDNSKIDINQLKNRIKNIKMEKAIVKINEHLASGNFKFILDENYRLGGDFRDFWGNCNIIEFNNEPSRVMSTNPLTFYNKNIDGEVSLKGNHTSVKKDLIIDILYKHWYNDEK